MPIIKVNGANVDYIQAGSGRDLVLLHSLLADRTAFDHVVPALAKKRRLTLVNLPGYGGSDRMATAWKLMPITLPAVLRALELPHDTDVLGNGLGGFIAVALACRHGTGFRPAHHRRLAVDFPPAGKEPLRLMGQRVQAQGMSAVLDAAINRIFPPAFIAAHPDIVNERKAVLAKADPVCFSIACAALARVDLTPLLNSIGNPHSSWWARSTERHRLRWRVNSPTEFQAQNS